jgi:hypothetical protein
MFSENGSMDIDKCTSHIILDSDYKNNKIYKMCVCVFGSFFFCCYTYEYTKLKVL